MHRASDTFANRAELLGLALKAWSVSVPVSELVSELDADGSWLQATADRLAARGVPATVLSASTDLPNSFRYPVLVRDGSGELFLASSPACLFASSDEERAPASVLHVAWELPRARRPWLRLLGACFVTRGLLGQLLAYTLLAGAIGLAPPLLVRAAIDSSIAYDAISLLGTLALGVLGARVFGVAVSWGRAAALRVLDGVVESATAQSAFSELMRLPYDQSRRASVGEKLQMLASAQHLSASLASLALTSALDLVLAAAYWLLLTSFAKMAGVVLFLASMLVLPVTALAAARHAALDERETRLRARERTLLHELLTAAHQLKAAASEAAAIRHWTARSLDERLTRLERERWDVYLRNFIDLFQQLTVLAVMAIVALFHLAGNMTLGEFLGLTMLADASISQVSRLAYNISEAFELRPHLKRMDLLDGAAAAPGMRIALPANGAAAAIRFDDVCFRYGAGASWVLRNVSFEIPRGSVAILEGPVGHGKSTTARLIAGLSEPQGGGVWVFGAPAKDMRHHVMYLPQTVRLFNGSIGYNLELWSQASPQQIEEASRRTGLDRLLGSLPMGAGSMVGEGGAELSAGQRQLVLLTAAVASDAPIVILDEALAHIDRALCEHIARGELFRDRTVVVVSHVPLLPEGSRAPVVRLDVRA
jgi:ABC-type bacteriocin/lantibiotic exporter with double-glycine peptidase domain